MDSNISKALWIGIGILFFIGVVTLGLSLFNKGRDVAEKQTDSLTNLEETLANSKYDSYDNRSVSGAEVLSAIKNFREEAETLSISVKTNKGSRIYLNSATFSLESVSLGSKHNISTIESAIKDARTETSTTYINPVAKFDATLRKDENGVVSGIVFVQE